MAQETEEQKGPLFIVFRGEIIPEKGTDRYSSEGPERRRSSYGGWPDIWGVFSTLSETMLAWETTHSFNGPLTEWAEIVMVKEKCRCEPVAFWGEWADQRGNQLLCWKTCFDIDIAHAEGKREG